MLLGKGFGASLVPAINGHQLRIWGRVERRGNFDIGMQSCRADGPAKRHKVSPYPTVVLGTSRGSGAWDAPRVSRNVAIARLTTAGCSAMGKWPASRNVRYCEPGTASCNSRSYS